MFLGGTKFRNQTDGFSLALFKFGPIKIMDGEDRDAVTIQRAGEGHGQDRC